MHVHHFYTDIKMANVESGLYSCPFIIPETLEVRLQRQFRFKVCVYTYRDPETVGKLLSPMIDTSRIDYLAHSVINLVVLPKLPISLDNWFEITGMLLICRQSFIQSRETPHLLI